MVRTQIQLTEEQSEALRRLAERQKTSMAALIRRAVDLCLRAGATATSDERRDRALAAAGRFRSGRGDLSEHHDEHLGEAFEG